MPEGLAYNGHMLKKVVLLIDAGHLRAQAENYFNISFVQNIVQACVTQDEELLKVLYYDCEPYDGKQIGPMSGQTIHIKQPNNHLREIENLDFFAVRRGTNKFRGWKRKGDHKQQAPQATGDSDFKPDIQQKGVDIRIALDIASIANSRYADRIILVSNDSDLTPAMKYARMAGLQVVLIKLPGMVNQAPMLPHTDIRRIIATWPEKPRTRKTSEKMKP